MTATKNVRTMTQMALLAAILLVLAATPLGFITIGVMTITFVPIPVLIGAIVLGPAAGGFLGLLFGVTSMIMAHIRLTPDALIFSPFLSGTAWSIFIAIVPRVLFGVIAGYLFRALRKTKLNLKVSAGITAGVGSILHTLMVLGSIYFLAGDLHAANLKISKNALAGIFTAVIGSNGIVEAIAAILICAALVTPLINYTEKGSRS